MPGIAKTYARNGTITTVVLLLTVLILNLVPFVTLNAASAEAIVTGTIVNGTTGGGDTGGVKVDLYTWENKNYLNVTSVTTDAQGNFTFFGLNNSIVYSYEAIATYAQVEYSSGVFQFENEEIMKIIPLNVYETTEDPANISVSLAHTVIYPVEGGLSIREIMVFENTGNRAYIGSRPSGESQHYEVLKFSLPQGAADLTPTIGLNADYLVMTDTGFIDTMPLAPGQIQLGYDYTVPGVGAKYLYQRVLHYPVQTFDVLIQGSNIGLSGNGFTRSDPLNMGGTVFSYYVAGNFTSGTVVSFTLTGLNAEAGSGISSNVIIIIVAVIVVGILAAVLVIQMRRKNAPTIEI